MLCAPFVVSEEIGSEIHASQGMRVTLNDTRYVSVASRHLGALMTPTAIALCPRKAAIAAELR